MPTARERVLYLLGAGFSAPLGIPVMSNFLFKARDQYAAATKKYHHFAQVFEQVNRMSVAKNFYNTDLFNIEEILSILDMDAQLRGQRLPEAVVRFICDVIEYHTPHAPEPDLSRVWNTTPWTSALFGEGATSWYAHFVAQLFGLHVQKRHGGDSRETDFLEGHVKPYEDVRYSVVTLNYDMVLELQATSLVEWYGLQTIFRTKDDQPDEGWDQAPYLAKLHGSVEGGRVVPPTWSKGIEGEALMAWRLAHRLMSQATQLRIIGYSLPVADAYVKYLMKSAALNSTRLKRIDIICLDADNSVRDRFGAFIEFPEVRFANNSAGDYVWKAGRQGFRFLDGEMVTAETVGLERTHEEFMRE